MIKIIVIQIFIFTLMVSMSSSAQMIEIDRYTLMSPEPQAEELDPLSVNVELAFPPNIITVEDAVVFVLENSGWVLAVNESSDNSLSLTLDRPLPKVHRRLSFMPLRSVLQVLVGQYYVPVEDPLRRIYTFDLKDEYMGLVKHD